jgi:hypothetical protein
MLTNYIQLLIILGTLISALVFIAACGMSVFKHFKRLEYIKKFSDYRAVLEYHLEKAYDMIHKEHILTYSLEAFRIDDKDYDKISKEFVKLVSKFIGPVLLREFVYLYGDDNTFVFNLLEYFSTKYENDEIRNNALEQITDTEIDDIT